MFCVFVLPRGKEEYLKPLSDVHSVLESLAAKEMEHFQSRNRTRYMVRGPLLGRMELVRQLYADGMHRIPLGLGESATTAVLWGGVSVFLLPSLSPVTLLLFLPSLLSPSTYSSSPFPCSPLLQLQSKRC